MRTTKSGAVEFKIITVADVLHFSVIVKDGDDVPSQSPLIQANAIPSLDSLCLLMSMMYTPIPRSVRAMKEVRIAAASTGSTRFTISSMTNIPMTIT